MRQNNGDEDEVVNWPFVFNVTNIYNKNFDRFNFQTFKIKKF